MRTHGVENLLVALLRHNAVRRVAVAAAEAEELLKRVFEVQLRAPAETLGERHGNRVSVVDLRKHISVGRIDHMTAENAREAVERKHRALARAAAGHDIIRRAGIEQDCRQNAVLHIGQLSLARRAVHAVVIHFMSHRGDDLLERRFDLCVLRRLAVFIDKCNTHKKYPPDQYRVSRFSRV